MYLKIKLDCFSENGFIKFCRQALQRHNLGLWSEYLDRMKGKKFKRFSGSNNYGSFSLKNTLKNGKRHYIYFDKHKDCGVRRHIIFKYDKATLKGYFFLYDVEMGE